MGTLIGIGATVYSNPVMAGGGVAAVTPDFHDDFTDVTDTALEAHVVAPIPTIAPPTWFGPFFGGLLKINANNEVVYSSGSSSSTYYAFNATIAPAKITCTMKNTNSIGGAGFMVRGADSSWSDGVYCVFTNEPTRIKIEFWEYTAYVKIGSTQYITSKQLTDTNTYVLEDDGLGLTVYEESDPTNNASVTNAQISTATGGDTYVGNTFVGICAESAVTTAFWSNFKVYHPAVTEISAANYPSAANVFDLVPSRVSGLVVTDVIAGLTFTTDEGGLVADGTVRSNEVGLTNFNESDAAVAAALDSPAAASPIMLVVSGKWEGTSESYGRSAGYGDFSPGTNDYLYVGATSEAAPSNDLWADVFIDDKTAFQATYTDGVIFHISGTILNPLWYTHLICVDPTVSNVTMYSIREGSSTIIKSTGSGTAFANKFLFPAGGSHITWHQMSVAFMGLFYPDVLPTEAEANNIVLYHQNKHSINKKYLHPWFESRAKYT